MILGIDPGLKATGYGFVECRKRRIILVETGTIQPKPSDSIENRLNRIYTILKDLIQRHQPQILVLEKLYAHYKHPITSSILGHVRGVVCLLCSQEKIELVEHSAKRIRKAVTGNGNASKLQTQRVVAHQLNLDEKKLTLDASDALALALGCIQIRNYSL